MFPLQHVLSLQQNILLSGAAHELFIEGINFYLRLGSILFNFILGVLNTVEYRVYHYFLLGSILLGGGGLGPRLFVTIVFLG